MALTFTTLPNSVTLVYNDMIVTIHSDTEIDTVTLSVVAGSNTRNFVLSMVGLYAAININKILQNFLYSELVLTNKIVSNNFIEYSLSVTDGTNTINSSDYTIIDGGDALASQYTTIDGGIANSEYSNVVDGGTVSSTFIALNASNKDFIANDYAFSSGNNGLFLNTQKDNIISTIGDKITLMSLGGGVDYIVTKTTSLGASVSYTGTMLSGRVVSLIIDTSLSWFNDAIKLTISSANNSFSPLIVLLKQRDARFPHRFVLAYVDSMGATNTINTYIGFDENLTLSKSTYESEQITRVYNSTATKKMTLLTDYMSEAKSVSLRDLWVSPVVADITDGTIKPIILSGTSVQVLRKRNSQNISYNIEFQYAEEYRILKH